MALPASMPVKQQTMSSVEIAKLTGKRHKNVLADIRVMLESLGQTSAEFSADVSDAYGRKQPGFALPKRETLILVSGYNVQVRAAIIDRWQELEADATIPRIPQTFSEALRLAADLSEQKAALESQLAIAAPRSDALALIEQANGQCGIRVAAKTLNRPPRQFVGELLQWKWLYRMNGKGSLVANQPAIDRGYMAHIETTVVRGGKPHTFFKPVFCPKGIARLAQRYEAMHRQNQGAMQC